MENTRPTELILLPSLKAVRGEHGGIVLTKKYLDGAAEFAKSWPGRVTTLFNFAPHKGTDLDYVEVFPDDLSSGLEERPQSEKELLYRLRSAAAVLGFLCPDEETTCRLCCHHGIPFVGTSELTPTTERQALDASVTNPIIRWRKRLWLWQAEKSRQRMLPLLAGLQCSGTPTYALYKEKQPNSILFFDNRVFKTDVISDAHFDAKAVEMSKKDTLRLIFGGRLVPSKGVMFLPRIAHELHRLGVDFTLDIYGGGALEMALREAIERLKLNDRVKLRGVLDFRKGWIPTLMYRADLFICPHPQGDPSSTYPEVMSCGVPIVGFNNEAFVGIVKNSGAAWGAPIGDVTALARIVSDLNLDRSRLISAAHRALQFASEHTFETTFKNRTMHLVKSSRLHNELKISDI
jgi:colanic acid/amylovoran biosynthesis glycosyltransferase